LESATADLGDAHELIVGAVVSLPLIVTVNVHCVPTSVVQTTLVVPTGKKEPDGGLQLKGGVPSPQLPDVVGFGYVTIFPHPPLESVMFAGHVIVQVVPPVIVTVKLQEPVFPFGSVAVQ